MAPTASSHGRRATPARHDSPGHALAAYATHIDMTTHEATAQDIVTVAALRLVARKRQAQLHPWTPEPHQIPPPGDWDTWMMRFGRGGGKTRAANEYALDHLRHNPKARIGMGAATISDARTVVAEGESGLITIAPTEFNYNRSLLEARHINGGYVKFLGAEEPNRWRGPQWTLLCLDELASWPRESYDQAMLGLRLGEHPRCIIATTPRPLKWLKAIEEDSTTVVTRATSRDNPHVSEVFRTRILSRYAGTRLGRQEIEAEYVEDFEGALWQRNWIDGHRVLRCPVPLRRVVVAIDPAVTANQDSDQTGIAGAGLGEDGEYYVLHLMGYRLSPDGWARRAVALYDQFEANRIVGEVNNGGDMVASTIRSVRQGLPFKTIHASRGKAVRAEPVAALYEQGKVHHVGVFAEAEDQMAAFPVATEHDDLVDALVYAITELMGGMGNVRFIDA